MEYRASGRSTAPPVLEPPVRVPASNGPQETGVGLGGAGSRSRFGLVVADKGAHFADGTKAGSRQWQRSRSWPRSRGFPRPQNDKGSQLVSGTPYSRPA